MQGLFGWLGVKFGVAFRLNLEHFGGGYRVVAVKFRGNAPTRIVEFDGHCFAFYRDEGRFLHAVLLMQAIQKAKQIHFAVACQGAGGFDMFAAFRLGVKLNVHLLSLAFVCSLSRFHNVSILDSRESVKRQFCSIDKLT